MCRQARQQVAIAIQQPAEAERHDVRRQNQRLGDDAVAILEGSVHGGQHRPRERREDHGRIPLRQDPTERRVDPWRPDRRRDEGANGIQKDQILEEPEMQRMEPPGNPGEPREHRRPEEQEWQHHPPCAVRRKLRRAAPLPAARRRTPPWRRTPACERRESDRGSNRAPGSDGGRCTASARCRNTRQRRGGRCRAASSRPACCRERGSGQTWNFSSHYPPSQVFLLIFIFVVG